MLRRSLAAVVALWICLAAPDAAGLSAEGGTGISAQADSVLIPESTAPSCPSSWPTATANRFDVYSITEYGNAWIDPDIDLLIDQQFGTNQLVNAVGQGEANALLGALDFEHENRFDWPLTDLAMAYQYFARSAAYDSLAEDHRFSLFPICTDTTRYGEAGHVDIYLVPARYDNEGDGVILTCGAGAQYPSGCIDADEDPQPQEWTANSFSITDNFGNRGLDESQWPLVAAHGAVHEFTHACWESNSRSYGQHGEGAYSTSQRPLNEFFACSSEYLTVPPDTIWGGDFRYIYSVLDDAGLSKDPTIDASTHKQRYQLWRLFGAYVDYQFNHPDSLQNALISRWARNVTDWGNDDVGMERTFCGLARILDDDGEFEPILGHDDGADRVSQMFSNYGIARWVDYPVFDAPADSQPYYFGPDFSPYYSAGQFYKHDNNYPYAWRALWEYVMPPEFILDEDNLDVWTSYPQPCPDDPDSMGWQDTFRSHDPASTGIYHGCVPVQLDLWGSNYLVFRADTLDFGWGSLDTLVVQLAWVDTGGDTLMNPRVELWLSVLRYSTSIDSLFLRGDRLRLPVTTERYVSTDADTVTVKVPSFRRDANEAVVVVLTLVSADYDGTGSAGCMTRQPNYGEPCVDLHYSYRFRVQSDPPDPPPGGCPFVSALGPSGYVDDNNVLAGAVTDGDDILDTYLLRHKPEAADEAYRLRLAETDTDRSRFDDVGLLAVDHAAGTNVGVFPDGTVGTYEVTAQPVACRDQDGNDVLGLVLASDGMTATLNAGGWLDVVFPTGAGIRSGGGVGEDGGPGQKIEESGGGRGDGDEGVLSLASQCYRANPCVGLLEMSEGVAEQDGLVTVRLTAPTDYTVDRLFLYERTEDEMVVTPCVLSGVTHSTLSDCLSALSSEDGTYASLAEGDTIDLAFTVPKMAGEARDFVLVTKGSEVSRGGDEAEGGAEAAAVTISPMISPNPFGPSTSIAFDVPAPGGRVAVSIYSMAGKLVRRLADTEMQPGRQTLTWDGRNEQGESLGSGVYFCRIEVPGQTDQKKLVLLK